MQAEVIRQRPGPKFPAMALSTTQLTTWMRQARRGDWCCYWNGFLARDRDKDERANAMAEIALKGWYSERFVLCQRRQGNGSWLYYMVRR